MATIKRLDDTAAFPALTGTATATGDQFLIWDVSAAAYKSITRAELLAAIAAGGGGGVDGSGYGNFTTRVGIGTASPTAPLHLKGAYSGATTIVARIESTDSNGYTGSLGLYVTPGGGGGPYAAASINGENSNNAGATDGGSLNFWTAAQDGSHTLTKRLKIDHTGGTAPGADNTQPLGNGSFRWSTVFAGTGAINTSGRDAKTEIRDASDAEKRAARRIRPRAYRLVDALASKGDQARVHFGYVAEDVRDALEAEGLDPWAYGLLCADPVVVRETVTVTAQRPVVETAIESRETVAIVDGNPTLVSLEVEVERPVGAWKPLLAAGRPVMASRGMGVGGETDQPVLHFVPALEDYETEIEREVATDEVRLGLRYDELAAFLRCADE